MFGRDLTEQVRADSKEEQRLVPVIVDKCIDAVDALGGSTFFRNCDLAFNVIRRS